MRDERFAFRVDCNETGGDKSSSGPSPRFGKGSSFRFRHSVACAGTAFPPPNLFLFFSCYFILTLWISRRITCTTTLQPSMRVHDFIYSRLRIPHFVVWIAKMKHNSVMDPSVSSSSTSASEMANSAQPSNRSWQLTLLVLLRTRIGKTNCPLLDDIEQWSPTQKRCNFVSELMPLFQILRLRTEFRAIVRCCINETTPRR